MRNYFGIVFLLGLTIFLARVSQAQIQVDNNDAGAGLLWQIPYIDAISNFVQEIRTESSITEKKLQSDSDEIWRFLKRRKGDWKHLLNDVLSVEELVAPRFSFVQKDYVKVLFPTKSGTLVFQLKDYPHIVIKIDNRPANAFDHKYRSYLTAFYQSQAVQNDSLYKRLFFPKELGRASQEEKVDVIFSEKIPLFSEAEIDNRILLHLVLSLAKFDEEPGAALYANPFQGDLRKAIRSMYIEVIDYICKVNFDDINYRNLPFTDKLQPVPFDTDTMLANTGVHTFLRLFFGYKVLTLRNVKAAMEACSAPYKDNPENILALYADHTTEDEIFMKNNEAIARMSKFFAKDPGVHGNADANKLAPLFENDERHVASMIDDLLAAKRSENNAINQASFRSTGRPAFQMAGTRCMHISDFMNDVRTGAQLLFKGKWSEQKIQETVAKILRVANFKGFIAINPGPTRVLASGGAIAFMTELEKSNDLRAFLCF